MSVIYVPIMFYSTGPLTNYIESNRSDIVDMSEIRLIIPLKKTLRCFVIGKHRDVSFYTTIERGKVQV